MPNLDPAADITALESRELSLGEAAQLCNKSVDTLRRRLRIDAIPGAHRDGDGLQAAWRIPVSGLLKAKLLRPGELKEFDQRVDPDLERLKERVVELEAQLGLERAQRLAADERLAQATGEVEHHRRVIERLVANESITTHRRSA